MLINKTNYLKPNISAVKHHLQ